MKEWKAKRFWTSAAVVPVANGFAIELDGRLVKTPAKATLVLPTEQLAKAVADEWQAQDQEINPATMPVTRTANAAIDKVTPQYAEVADLLAAYGDSDLLCYRAEAPAELVARQLDIWEPMLDWAAENLGVRLRARSGIIHKPQDPDALAQLTSRVHALGPFELTAFHDLVSLSGSLILAFAAAYDARPAEELWDISRLDETYQADRWGRDDDAELLAANKKSQFLHAKRVFYLAQITESVLPDR